jgi:hypothetical protein
MDHVVYLDHKANEFEKLLNGQKTMIIRGAAGRKMPYGRVETNDTLYFIENDGSGVIKARGNVVGVLNSDKMTKEASTAFVDAHQDKLSLSKVQYERWAGKRFLVLIEIDQIVELAPFKLDRHEYGNMDDWLPVGSIDLVRSSP